MLWPSVGAEECQTQQDVAANLQARYQETLQGAGIASGGGLVQIFAAPGGSWSLVVTLPGGCSYIMSGGEGWQARHTGDQT